MKNALNIKLIWRDLLVSNAIIMQLSSQHFEEAGLLKSPSLPITLVSQLGVCEVAAFVVLGPGRVIGIRDGVRDRDMSSVGGGGAGAGG
jgi:hypothetical protein